MPFAACALGAPPSMEINATSRLAAIAIRRCALCLGAELTESTPSRLVASCRNLVVVITTGVIQPSCAASVGGGCTHTSPKHRFGTVVAWTAFRHPSAPRHLAGRAGHR